MKPIIGICANETTIIDSDSHWVSYTPKNFVSGCQQAGGLPLLLPISKPADCQQYVQQIDKLLLTGGQDVDPRFYGELPHQTLGGTQPERDHFELALIKEARARGKPILGICRGMQLLNVALGGSLYQDLSLRPSPSLKHVQVPTPFRLPSHPVEIEKDSLLAQILPTSQPYQVNSFHHQTIHEVAPSFTIAATAPDGVIEALENKQERILAIQWHPELTFDSIKEEQGIFDYFVNQL